MARQDRLPRTLPPRLVVRTVAAAYVSVAPATFDAMVKDGRMPRAKLLGPRRKAWDVLELDRAIDDLPVNDNDDDDDSWDNLDAS
jgi:predicted DNA-binding transcriptional regulator AlpA